MMKKNYFIATAVALVVLTFFISTAVSVRSLSKVTDNNEENYAKVIAANVYDIITNHLEEPIYVGQTMAHDAFVNDILLHENSHSEKDEEEIVCQYLQGITDGIGFSTAFLISDNTGRYYTQKGFNKIVDPDNDEHDIWYKLFVDKNRAYDFDVDADETSGDAWMVFVNNRIEDEKGELLGVCGVGVIMTDLQKKLAEIQLAYDVQICLVDENGLVNVDVDDVQIESAVLEGITLDSATAGYIYEKEKDGYVVTKYMEDLGLYLVIQSTHDKLASDYKEMIYNNIITMVAIWSLIILIMIIVLTKGNQFVSLQARTSGLTSLANIYVSMHLIDIKENTFVEIKSNDAINSLIDKTQTAAEQIRAVMTGMSTDDFRDEMVTFVDLSTLPERMKGMRTLSHEFVGKQSGWCRARFISEDADLNNIEHVIIAVEVIEEEKQREKELIELSETDLLTGILNRGSGEKKISDYLLQKQPGMLILLDADEFKSVNDTFGHDVGDIVIKEIANSLKDTFRDKDIVMRLGGDEFCAYVVGITDHHAAREAVERLFDHIEMMQISQLRGRKVTVSVGAALYDGVDRIPFAELYKKVDNMLYESKKTAGNYCTFDK